MPCNDWGSGPGYVENPVNISMKKRLDNVTRLLCSTCKKLDADQIEAIKGLSEWWEQHQAEDRERERAEETKRLREESRLERDIAALSKKLAHLKKKRKDGD